MKPILYAPDETAFVYNGEGTLPDVVECVVTCERNGIYKLEMEYPVNGMRAELLRVGYCIKARANDRDRPQIFRIYNVSATLRGTKAVKANHISYDLTGRPVKPYTASGTSAAVAGIESHAVIATGFEFSTDLTSTAQYQIVTPRSARAVLGGADGSLLDVYGGELYFDNYKVSLLKDAGQDNNVTIRYGKNLTQLEQELDNSDAGNGIFPYWYKEDDGLVTPSGASRIDWQLGYNCYRTLDVTDQFKTKPTAAQLTAYANALVPHLATTQETLDVSFVALHQLKEYETIAMLEKVGLCDTVRILYTVYGDDGSIKLRVNTKTKVVKTVYNVLTEKYNNVELGTLKKTLADYIVKG